MADASKDLLVRYVSPQELRLEEKLRHSSVEKKPGIDVDTATLALAWGLKAS